MRKHLVHCITGIVAICLIKILHGAKDSSSSSIQSAAFDQSVDQQTQIGDADFCSKIFVSARGAIEKYQSALLGFYEHAGFHNGKPYYIKYRSNDDNSYKFFYRKAEAGIYGMTLGWLIGPSLQDHSIYISTRVENLNSPVGISGAYDRGKTYDQSFKVECHDDDQQPKVECCSNVWVQSTGSIKSRHFARLGLYTATGQIYNGHYVYSIEQFGYRSYLFFQKMGISIDGWMIDSRISTDSYAITTRVESACPDTVLRGYDVNKITDETFKIYCSTNSTVDIPSRGRSLTTSPLAFTTRRTIDSNRQFCPSSKTINDYRNIMSNIQCPTGIDHMLCNYVKEHFLQKLMLELQNKK